MAASHQALSRDEALLSTPRIQASPWLVLVVLAMGEFMILLSTTIVSVAVPTLSTDLHSTLDEVLWVLNAYTLVFAVLLITSGRLGEMFGPKKMFLTGLAIFTLSSLACGLATSPLQLIIFRLTQGVGAAALMPQTLSVITSIFPPEKRGAAFGAWAGVAGFAAVAGPTLGGALVTAFSWRAVFFPNVPIGLAAIILASLMMPEVTVQRRRRIDLGGITLATIGLVGIIFGLVEGQKYQWGRINQWGAFDLGSIHASLISIPSIFAASIFLLICFILFEVRQEEPLLPLSLFRDRNYSLGNVVGATVNFAILGFFFPLTLFLQSVLGMSALHAGLVIAPNALVIVLTAPISGRLTDRVGGKYLLLPGLSLFMLGLFLVARTVSLSSTEWSFTLPLVVTGLGMGFTFAPMTSTTMRNIVPTAAGAASGFLNTVRQVGAAIGSAVVGAVLADRLSVEMQSQAQQYALQLPSPYRAGFIRGVSRLATGGLRVGAGQTKLPLPRNLPPSVAHQMQALGQLVYHHAFLNSMRPSIFASIAALLFGATATLVMRGRRVVEPGMEREPVSAGPMPAISAPMDGSGTVLMPLISAARHLPKSAYPIHLPFVSRIGSAEKYTLRDRPLKIGRLNSSDITLDHPKVSRQHAGIVVRDGIVLVRDMGSSNGTFVNGVRVEGERPLRDGDVIAVGDDAFIVRNDIERARPRLVQLSDGTMEYPITRTITLGRLAGNDIQVNDPRVSRRHAEIRFEDGNVVLRDLETLNGTFVNGEAVQGEWALNAGDIVAVGGKAFVYYNEFEAGKSAGKKLTR